MSLFISAANASVGSDYIAARAKLASGGLTITDGERAVGE